MRWLIYTWIIFPLALNGQSLYSGKDKFKQDVALQIDRDSSIVLIQRNHYGYYEYNGRIKRINDTLFNIKARLVFSQAKCRAVGDTVVYVTIDTTSVNEIKNVIVIYSNGQMESSAYQGQKQSIPLNKKLFTSDPGKNYFSVSVGHKSSINNKDINTVFKLGEEHCISVYAKGNAEFKIVIKKNIVRSIDNKSFGKFTLIKRGS